MVCRLAQFVIVTACFGSALRFLKEKQGPGSCPKTVEVRGTPDPASGVKTYTMKYATAPRYEQPKMIEIPLQGQGIPLDATVSAPHCMQGICVACGWKITPKMIMSGLNGGSEGVEDCLFMSYFVPNTGQTGLPMAFHVHHGQGLYGFKMELPEVKKVVQNNIAVVTANMRLGALGIFAHPEIEQPNFQVADIITALQHVQKYACVFGGDANRVTITGSSSGANLVAALLASPQAKGLFSGAWLNSPSGLGIKENNVHAIPSAEFHDRFVKPCMAAAGCTTLTCLKEMEGEDLLHKFQGDKSCSLVRYNAQKDMDNGVPGFPYDNKLVPNLMEKACTQQLASAHVPVVVGHAKDELDSLKFQFPDLEKGSKKYFSGLIPEYVNKAPVMSLLQSNSSQKQEMDKAAKEQLEDLATQVTTSPATQQCIVNRLHGQQEAQEHMEDAGFNMGSYMFAGKKAGAGPRWHFTITAPSSVTGRSWHTTPEIMVWNAAKTKTSPLYHALTKEYVTGNASPELLQYVAENFVNFIKTGAVLDQNWPQTKAVPGDQLGGLPSVDLSNDKNVATVTDQYHHHHHALNAVHCLTCNKKLPAAELDGLNLKNCITNPQEDGGLSAAEQQSLKQKKMGSWWRDMNLMSSFTPGSPSSLSTMIKSMIHDATSSE